MNTNTKEIARTILPIIRDQVKAEIIAKTLDKAGWKKPKPKVKKTEEGGEGKC
jgi:hypothetical protein